jgi:predicted phage terminase large subunit-like protein
MEDLVPDEEMDDLLEAPAGASSVSIPELVRTGAVNSAFFARSFFPNTVRWGAAPFHARMWAELENPNKRFVNLRCFRGSAKTTLLTLFIAKRVAYSVSRTILCISASEAHAARRIQWLRGAIDRNPLFAQTFGLSPGKKWQETEIEIMHGVDQRPIWILGVGITGNIRGINFDDYRPDLIVLDDVITDENANTEEQREKINDLILGAVTHSLAPKIDAPNAKLAMLQTPLHDMDASSLAARSAQWSTITIPCWTPETMNLSVDEQVSAWPQVYPTKDLRQKKKEALANNSYRIFAREMECKLVAGENSSFRPNWLQTYSDPPLGGMSVLAIDPVPPPSDKAMANALKGKDYEAQVIVTKKNGEYYVREVVTNRGHEPNWSVATALRLATEYRVSCIVVEAVAYQRVLKYLLEQEMKRLGRYWLLKPLDRKQNKFVRITAALSGPGSAKRLFVREAHEDLRQQWTDFPNGSHDDIVDALATAITELDKPTLDLSSDEYAVVDGGDEFLRIGGAP